MIRLKSYCQLLLLTLKEFRIDTKKGTTVRNIIPTATFMIALSSSAYAHTNSVGFLLSGTQASGTCVAGVTTAVNCVNVEVFFGSWHSEAIPARGDLALWFDNGDGTETQVIGQSTAAPGSNIQVPFSLSHSLISTLPNYTIGGSPVLNYGDKTSSAYTSLSSSFSLGSNYFWGGATGLVGDPANATMSSNTYKHQSAVANGLGAGTYRVAYEATTQPRSADWQPTTHIQSATFTITQGGSVVVNNGGDAAPLIQGPNGYAGDAISSKSLTSGDTTVHTFTASEAVTWSISGGDDAAAFLINSSTGALTFASGGACDATNDPGADMLYKVRVTATDTGNNTPSQDVTLTCPTITTNNAPTALVATAGNGQVSIAFTAPSNIIGAAITDYEYELNGGGTWTSASTAATPVVITGLTNGTAYSIKLRAVNSAGSGTESAAVSVLLGSPASDFAAKEDAIRSVITSDAQRSLNSTLASNTRLTRDARARFLTSSTQMQSDGASLASCNNEALDVAGTAIASADQLATQGTFSAQTGNFEGTKCRFLFGDFDVQHDGNTGSTTATINGKIAWEQMLSEQAMLGYYLGGAVSRSNIKGSFAGTQNRYGVSVGGYFVQALQENLFLEGFASLGAGRNNLEIADDTLALTSNYTTQTVTLGTAISGVVEQTGYDILPELSIAYGKTNIGSAGFTGVAYSLTDDTLSLDAGSVSTASIMFRPEFRVPIDGLAASESHSVFSFAPRLMCERVKAANTASNCGNGVELGISSSSSNGLTSLNTTIIADRVGNSTRSSLQFNLQHKF